MKIVLDIDLLRREGKITQGEYDKLLSLSSRSTASSAFNLLIGFGVVAIAGGLIALLPEFAEVVGLGLALSSLSLRSENKRGWQLLADICLIVGALIVGGALIARTEGHYLAFLSIGVGYLGLSFLLGSGLLASLGVLALASGTGTGAAYAHASYFIWVSEPTVAIALFSLLGVAFFALSKRLPALQERSAIFAARTAVFLVNLGFWIGSLWGDSSLFLPRWVFTLSWAAVIVVGGAWAVRSNRTWLLNVCAVFGAIHLYTQYFELLGVHPLSIVLGGVSAIAGALCLWRHNQRA